MHAGWKAGVTGANGVGKSSLFALVGGELHPDEGDIDVPPGWVTAVTVGPSLTHTLTWIASAPLAGMRRVAPLASRATA